MSKRQFNHRIFAEKNKVKNVKSKNLGGENDNCPSFSTSSSSSLPSFWPSVKRTRFFDLHVTA
jgi:hypothetical protein